MKTAELKLCPFCGGEPELRRVGDNKQYNVYFCSQCGQTPVRCGEATMTQRGARKMWNKRVSERE